MGYKKLKIGYMSSIIFNVIKNFNEQNLLHIFKQNCQRKERANEH